MKQKKLKKFVVPTIYTLAIVIFCSSIYLIKELVNKSTFKESESLQFVDNEIFNDIEYVPVINEQITILKPFNIDNITISNSYYDNTSDKETQEKSLIYYQGTYMQNSGISYTNNVSFDIISILDGRVIEVSENELLGTTIKIQHQNNLISIYQCLDNVTLKENDQVSRGQIIGTSGVSAIYNENYNLHFELIHNGVNVNPDNYYNKTEDEI